MAAMGSKILPSLAVTIGLCVSACGAVDEFEEVITDRTTIPGTNSQVMLPIATPFAAQFEGGFNRLELSQARSFQNNGVEPGDVDAIFVKGVRLTMSAGGGGAELNQLSDYLEKVELFVEAPGVERKIVAALAMFPEAATADLTITPGLNLKAHATAESMTIGADIVLRQQPFLNITLETTVTLLVDVNLLGA